MILYFTLSEVLKNPDKNSHLRRRYIGPSHQKEVICMKNDPVKRALLRAYLEDLAMRRGMNQEETTELFARHGLKY